MKIHKLSETDFIVVNTVDDIAVHISFENGVRKVSTPYVDEISFALPKVSILDALSMGILVPNAPLYVSKGECQPFEKYNVALNFEHGTRTCFCFGEQQGGYHFEMSCDDKGKVSGLGRKIKPCQLPLDALVTLYTFYPELFNPFKN